MADITRKERTDIVTDITERATVTKKIMERAAVMYVIPEQYRTCNRNDEHYGMTIMTYITDLKRKWKAFQA